MPSSVIRSYSYDERTRSLDVMFVSGLRYRYADVPREVAEDFGAAPSLGVYFNDHIRDHFAYERQRKGSEPARRLPGAVKGSVR